jgi:DNA-binding response OmpR family regulator
VEAHLRRENRRRIETKVFFHGELSIDYTSRVVSFKNTPIHFVKKEFDIIELLSQNAGQVFDKERIYERVWGYGGEGDSSVVAEHIRRIRVKFSAAKCDSYIETVWGCGYKWIK